MNHHTKVREQLLETVRALTFEQLNAHPQPGKWSIAQVMEHLYLTERTLAQVIIAGLKSKDINPPSERKPVKRVIDRSIKIEAPPPLIPIKDEWTLEDLKGCLEESKGALERIANKADQSQLASKSFPHPVFGALTLEQWLEFVPYHEERHLLQIKEIKEKLR